MKMFALTVALLLAASPVAAQQQLQQALGAGGQINNSTLPNTGLICIEEMVATFCNRPVGPNNAGYGSSTAFSGSSARSGTSCQLRIERRVQGAVPHQYRWYKHYLHSALRGVSVTQRIVQLSAR